MTELPVLAAQPWRSNAELIADVARLYIAPDDLVLDPTYGNGIWWQKFRPPNLVTHDVRLDGVDFRDLPEASYTFDVVAYDPPYVSPGGRKTSKLDDMHDRYGMRETPRSPAGLQQLINDGFRECVRVLKAGGIILVKCQDYISSGKYWNGTYHTQRFGITDLGLTQLDRFEHVGSPRPQPPRNRQVHARRNLSTLFVFRKP